ncbi:MAG TPA: extracellular solute-binding protein [Burkholderiaceae bacterium]|nr:extracellular solute-binding protein [Burkholderiaceae bacterium]
MGMRSGDSCAAALARGWLVLALAQPALRWASAAALLTCLSAMAALAWAADDSKVLNVYNWSDYIGDTTIRDFEKETGIKVNYDTFDSNEALYAKLRAGHTGYDIVVPSSHWAKRQIEGHLLLKLDKSKITTYGNLDPWLMGELAVSANDPGNNYVVPWLWGLSTVGINVDKVKAALGSLPMPENAWDLIFKPEYASRLKSCGLSLLDSGDEVFPAALHYIGRPGFSHDRADYEAAAKMLKAMRPYVTLFSSSGYINGLADGSLCAVFGWSGDIAIAGQRAKEAHNGQKIVALVPKTGAYMFFDTMAMPVDAPHVENAYKWISYIYRPQVQAGIVNKVLHANPVRAADKLLNPDVRNSSSVFFKPEELARVAPPEAIPDDMLRVRTRLFTAFKTGE